MVKLSELKKKFAEELKKKKEEEGILNGITEELEILVLDMRYTSGGLANLYTIKDGYTAVVDENVKRIEEIIKKGKIAKIKAYRIIGSKRIDKIISIDEIEDPDISENDIWRGDIEYVPPAVRFIREDGEVYWIDSSLNLERLMKDVTSGETKPIILIPAITYKRMSSTGRVFNRIRGFYYTIVEELPDQVEV